MLLQPLEQMFSSPPAAVAVSNRTWAAIPAYLDAEIAAGEATSSRKKAKTAVNGLLGARKLTADNAYINLDWFDKVFPLDGWDHSMPLKDGTWQDYIYRVYVPLIERITGADVEKKTLRALEDDWTEDGAHLGDMEIFKSFGGAKRLIPFCSTLTMEARQANLRTRDIDDPTLRQLHDAAHGNKKRSLRSVSELIAELQSTTAAIWKWFPHRITPIEAEGPFKYQVPPQLVTEVEDFVERASRKRYIRVKKKFDYVEDGTRTNYRTTLHADSGRTDFGRPAATRIRMDLGACSRNRTRSTMSSTTCSSR